MASGDFHLITSIEQPSSSYATIDERNSHLVFEFDAAADESIHINSIIPGTYANGGHRVRWNWTGDTATSGNVVWTASFERLADGGQDIDSDSFASTKTTTDAAPGTSGSLKYSYIDFTDSEVDGAVAGELVRIKLTRTGSSGSDTMAGDAQIKVGGIYVVEV